MIGRLWQKSRKPSAEVDCAAGKRATGRGIAESRALEDRTAAEATVQAFGPPNPERRVASSSDSNSIESASSSLGVAANVRRPLLQGAHTGDHLVTLTANGKLLASATFANETPPVAPYVRHASTDQRNRPMSSATMPASHYAMSGPTSPAGVDTRLAPPSRRAGGDGCTHVALELISQPEQHASNYWGRCLSPLRVRQLRDGGWRFRQPGCSPVAPRSRDRQPKIGTGTVTFNDGARRWQAR